MRIIHKIPLTRNFLYYFCGFVFYFNSVQKRATDLGERAVLLLHVLKGFEAVFCLVLGRQCRHGRKGDAKNAKFCQLFSYFKQKQRIKKEKIVIETDRRKDKRKKEN